MKWVNADFIQLGKVMIPPGENGPTIEQEIEAGGRLGEVYGNGFGNFSFQNIH